MKTVEKYGLFEMCIKEMTDFGLVKNCGKFTIGNIEKEVPVFKHSESEYMLRFMPEEIGVWSYTIDLGDQLISGKFECTVNTGNNHGFVKTDGFQFIYADHSRYVPFGTTCYAWINQLDELQERTLETLKNSCFNKVRMCIFPKSMPYNNNEPENFPFLKKDDGKWDVYKIDYAFWNNLDKRIQNLCDLGIEADLILFHPYDRWGLTELSQEESLVYLNYCIARYAAYRNIWWSLANEYEMVYKKSIEDWNEYGEKIIENDIYNHLISIHHIFSMYPKKNWMTHCSVQSKGLHFIPMWRQTYEIPVIIDECGYEGDIEHDWGNLSAFEMVNNFWITYCRGGYCTHGETFDRKDEVLWWAKGGVLYGESEKRISFLKEIVDSLPGQHYEIYHLPVNNPNQEKDIVNKDNYFNVLFQKASPDRQYDMLSGKPMILFADDYRLQYFGKSCPSFVKTELPSDGHYRIEVIDIWAMTRTMFIEGISGQIKIGLPAKEGIAILITRLGGASLKLK